MASDAILRSYGDVSVREDVVMNAVELLTAQEDYIQNRLGKTTAIAPTHSFLVDTLRSVATLAAEEAADDTASANSTPTRLSNLIQLSRLNFKVSRMQQAVEHYTGRDELEYQTEKALKDFGNSVEFDLVRQTLVSGVSGTAPKLSGLIEATSKANNHTSHTSTTAWAASILDGLMKGQYEASNGDATTMATDIFMGSFLRNVTDTFTQKSNVVVNAAGITTVVKTVSVYQNAFGSINVHVHRYIQQSTDAHGRVLLLNPAKFKIAYLANGGKPMIDTTLARSGPYDVRAIQAMWTLETHNRNAAVYADGFVNA